MHVDTHIHECAIVQRRQIRHFDAVAIDERGRWKAEPPGYLEAMTAWGNPQEHRSVTAQIKPRPVRRTSDSMPLRVRSSGTLMICGPHQPVWQIASSRVHEHLRAPSTGVYRRARSVGVRNFRRCAVNEQFLYTGWAVACQCTVQQR